MTTGDDVQFKVGLVSHLAHGERRVVAFTVRSWFPRSAKRANPVTETVLAISPQARGWLLVWSLWLLIPAVIGYVALTKYETRLRVDAQARHAARLDPAKNDAVVTPLDLSRPAGHENDPPAMQVETGIYVTRIPKLSPVASSWTVDFYIWFVWHGPATDPGETFKIVSGEIASKSLMRRTDTGDRHYSLYRVNAEITKEFDLSRFPRDEHLLTLVIEDQGLQYHQMVYTTNERASAMSSRVFLPGYAVGARQVLVKGHTYKTAMGDPELPLDYRATYSDFVMGIPLVRPNWGVFIKMFLPLFLAIALALAGLFATGPAERLGVVSTALFVAVVNGMVINEIIPDTGITTLADIVTDLGYVLIGQTLIQAILYGRFFSDRSANEGAARLFDWSTFILLSVEAVALNVGIVAAASA